MIINENTLYNIYRSHSFYKGTDFKVVEHTIDSSDAEDGGADHTIVIQDLSTGKFYMGEYTDWDIDYNFSYNTQTNEVIRCDFDNDLTEVFPHQITKTIYKTKP